jgi:hypothetical protein
LDERRQLRIVAFGEKYLVDIEFALTASYGDVKFTSDAVHYAWPYVRMSSEWSVDRGGTITNSQGDKNQQGTNDQTAQWVDYSNTVADRTEGLAILSHPQNAHPHRWLTRDTAFGPRRADGKRPAIHVAQGRIDGARWIVHRETRHQDASPAAMLCIELSQ